MVYATEDEPDVLNCHSAEQQNTWDHMTGEQRADWLCGQLWNCNDILPSLVASEFDLQRNTYAALVRYLHPLVHPEHSGRGCRSRVTRCRA